MKKYFNIFELDESASLAELEQAYKELSNAWRLENFQNFPRHRRKAELKLQEINKAYDRLKSHLAIKSHLAADHHQPASPKIESNEGSLTDRLSKSGEGPDLERTVDPPPWEPQRPTQPAKVISRSHIQKGVQKSLVFGLVAILAVLVVLLLYRLF
jgi:curved DNA-binding protein CbpA